MKEEIARIIEQSNPSCGLKKACNTECGEGGAGRIIDLLEAEIDKMENPYSEDVFPMTTEKVGEYMRERLGDKVTTALSGTLCRLGYSNAIQNIKKLLEG